MKRRDFLTGSIAATALLGLSCAARKSACGCAQAATGNQAPQEYYELRAYRLSSAEQEPALDAYLEKAAIPALNKLGVTPVGVFAEKEPKTPPTVYVLATFPTLHAFKTATGVLAGDPALLKKAADYLGAPKGKPPFERIDSWLLLAFSGMPKMELPAYSKERKPRLFELRTYESYSEAKALKKVDMFNDGEMQVMRDVGLAPVFFGQALIGPNLPHLTYMTSAENEELHKQHWAAFGKHPTWNKMKNDPQYADTATKITRWMLVPKPYSQI